MAGDRETWRDWHRLFGLLLTDFFTGSPYRVRKQRLPAALGADKPAAGATV